MFCIYCLIFEDLSVIEYGKRFFYIFYSYDEKFLECNLFLILVVFCENYGKLVDVEEFF